ncbi:hypothetical protein A2363_05130 [Candidatus Gottesmanbacteria bacterium RIFOXYB1_FULL_47_11]|uniref:Uncharacterized protein n=1 Tax=Candidatus Gottesmanbacteria bacterium RIFOXYB1_FULL_47_11 TaxID=1798401 RepID=A0A1F6BFB1_9BACT|nr:MAG: hypothetical protein A2363_05130 [Candidatus Gottesmanbacteria bacterium RIFOXYB1_FULL_47_11]
MKARTFFQKIAKPACTIVLVTMVLAFFVPFPFGTMIIIESLFVGLVVGFFLPFLMGKKFDKETNINLWGLFVSAFIINAFAVFQTLTMSKNTIDWLAIALASTVVWLIASLLIVRKHQ